MKTTLPCLLLSAFVSVAAVPGLARAEPGGGTELESALASWRAEHGPGWQLRADTTTGTVEMLFGGRAAAPFAPRSDADFVELAWRALAETAPLHRLELDTLSVERTLFLPLGQVGSGDKETVRLRQQVGGVPVEDGSVNLLFSADGALLSLQSTALRGIRATPTVPALSAGRASGRAALLFTADHGLAPTRLGLPELVIARGDELHPARLAWKVDAQWYAPEVDPLGTLYTIDAGDGTLIARAPSIHHFDVGGTVRSMASPGTLPDISSNPEQQLPMAYLEVKSAQGDVTTDANGNFLFPGLVGPLQVTVKYQGTFNDLTNNGAASYSLTTTLQTGTSNSILMNPSSAATITSQANAFRCVDVARDWVRSINPSDSTADFVASADVNQQDTCNAYWNGSSINFFLSGGGCVNSSYSTVIAHEAGHWFNALYGTGNGSDGIGEGNADVWAMYEWDTPTVGQNFSGSSAIRSGNNTRLFCGDSNPGCYGEVHADGEPWMGAAWKVRNRLNTSLGNALGDLTANHLFLGWMNAYNQTQIKSIIEVQWLVLDDDDGNLGNGTPHFTDIDQGFRQQGFPGFTIPGLAIFNVTALPDTQDQTGPYLVSAALTANANPPILSATLVYRVDGGTLQPVPMTHQSGATWTASIPGQPSPAHVEYFVTVTDNASLSASFPPGAPADFLDFDVALVHVLYANDFDVGPVAGWTHGAIAGTDEWQRGTPTGLAGSSGGIAWSDPHGDYGATGRCWGTDLGGAGFNGTYPAGSDAWLRSPAINCSTAQGTKLRFKRWLSVQGSASDQARIRVNGVEVWSNPVANQADTGWTAQEVDLSAVADGQPAVQVEWSLASNGTVQLGGWQIDEVEMLWLGVVIPPCPEPVPFCTATPNSFSPTGAAMIASGSTHVGANDLTLLSTGVPPGKTGLYFYGQNETSPVVFGNGVRCVASPFFRLSAAQANFAGDLVYPLDLAHLPVGGGISAGEVWKFQLWYRDPDAGGAQFNTSDALSLSFCP